MKKYLLLSLCLSISFLSVAQSDHSTPKAFLGIHSNHVSKDKAEALNFENPNGAYVTSIIENTAAEKAGIQPFDYLTGINNEAFTSGNGFNHMMRNMNAGDEAVVQLVRNGQAMSMPLILGKQSDAIYRKIPKEEEPFFGVKQDHYNWRENVPGVKVGIVDNSAAAAMGLQDEDIITNINGNRIIDWHDLGTAIDNMKPGDPIQVNYLRNGKPMTGSTSIKSYGQTYHQNNNAQSTHSQKSVVQTETSAETAEEPDTETEEDLRIPIETVSQVDMEDMTEEEAEEMKEKVGVDMPVINNLEIEKLNIFPNPNDGIFNLAFDLPNRGQTTIRIFNGVGRLIYQNDMQQFSGKFNDRLDISNRAKGIYFLEVNQDGKSITKKVIFQ